MKEEVECKNNDSNTLKNLVSTLEYFCRGGSSGVGVSEGQDHSPFGGRPNSTKREEHMAHLHANATHFSS